MRNTKLVLILLSNNGPRSRGGKRGRAACQRLQQLVEAVQDGREAAEGARGDPSHPASLHPPGQAPPAHQVPR